MKPNISENTDGLYTKFLVKRTDGSSEPGGKHEHCRSFVIDLDHDPHAPAAIRAYADSCRVEYPKLALDLDAIFPSKRGSLTSGDTLLAWMEDQHHLYDYWVKAGPGGNGWACYEGHPFKSKENYIKVRDHLAEQIRLHKWLISVS